ncbi:hypothetical protein LCGC14_0734700 [marine sediment metagenome]|uniref:Uncharacterized protein n=1 Tax=marine sediment metagenome TaxID=412755 RepID=A0A0F9TFV5_9ZZZZ
MSELEQAMDIMRADAIKYGRVRLAPTQRTWTVKSGSRNGNGSMTLRRKLRLLKEANDV